MKKYIISSLIAVVLVFGVATQARAEGSVTIAELQAMIAKLSAQIAALSNQQGTFDEISSKSIINTNLTVGSRGVNVVTLQNFLVGEGFLNIPSGLAKGYFGQLTKSAVIRYQTAVGLSEKDGYVGPTTRQKINAMLDGHDVTGDEPSQPGQDFVITSVTGMAAGNFEIDLNSKAVVRINGIGTDPGAIKVYVGGIESTVIQASENYIYFKTPVTGLTVGSVYDLYLVKGNKRSNTVKVKVISKVTVYVDTSSTTPVLRIEADRNIYNRNVVILPGKEESLFAVGYDITGSVYANALEVRFERTSGSDGFFEYADSVALLNRFNQPMSYEGSVSYDGNTTIYKFNKLAYKINSSEDFYVKVKAKTNLDKSAKFTMKVPQNGLRVGDSSYASGTIVNTITFDPTYTLQKAETTATQSYVKVTSPNNGGVFNKGETIEIKYETNLNTTNSDGVTLQLYKTTKIAGQPWIPTLTIATKLKEGKYVWSIPTDLQEGEYNIYAVGQGVFADGVSIGDYSDMPVTIK